MTREEIFELLRNELAVDVRLDSERAYYDEAATLRVRVSLRIGDDVISESSDTVSIEGK